MWLIVGYAKRKKSPTSKERNTVIKSCKTVCCRSERGIFVSSHSTIFMAGNAIKTSITIEKTSVRIIFSMVYIP